MSELAGKLAKARQKLGSLQPDKTNKEQNYGYISADKILERAGDVLAEVGVVVIPTVITVDITTVDRPNKSPRIDALLKMSMNITDGDGDGYTAFWVGIGSDYMTPDKAVYKAITSGHKYFLMKLLNIGVGNEDGEHENGEEQKPPARSAQPASRPAQPAQHVDPIDAAYPPMPQDWQEAKAATPSAPPAQYENKPMNGAPRPYTPANLKDAIAKQVKAHEGKTASAAQSALCAMMLDVVLMDEGKDARHALVNWLFGQSSIKLLTGPEVLALLKWINSQKDSGGDYHPGQHVAYEAKSAYKQALVDEGQAVLPI